jgi:hypothetical protein
MPSAAPAIVALDRDGLPLDCAAKTCSGTGLSTLQHWLGDGKAEVLLLHNGKGKPLVLVNWDTWNRVASTVIKGDFPEIGPVGRLAGADDPSQGFSPLVNAR